MSVSQDRPRTLDVAFVLTAVLLFDTAFTVFALPWQVPDAAMATVAVHLLASIYVGWIVGWRRLTWAALVIAYVATIALALSGYLVPWGEYASWMRSLGFVPYLDTIVETVGRLLPQLMLLAAGGVTLAILVVDAVLMQRPTMTRRRFARLTLAAVTCAFALRVVSVAVLGVAAQDQAAPLDEPVQLLPEFYILPWLSILRAVPGQTAALALMFVCVAAPGLALFYRAERLRRGPVRGAWRFACAALVAATAGLGWLAAQPSSADVILWSRVLMAAYLALFFVVPFALLWFVGPLRSDAARRETHGG